MTVTIGISLVTKGKPESELVGLVYGCTEVPTEQNLKLTGRPIFWAALVCAALILLNVIFR